MDCILQDQEQHRRNSKGFMQGQRKIQVSEISTVFPQFVPPSHLEQKSKRIEIQPRRKRSLGLSGVAGDVHGSKVLQDWVTMTFKGRPGVGGVRRTIPKL